MFYSHLDESRVAGSPVEVETDGIWSPHRVDGESTGDVGESTGEDGESTGEDGANISDVRANNGEGET